MVEIGDRLNGLRSELGDCREQIARTAEKIDGLGERLSEFKGALDGHLSYCRDMTLKYTSKQAKQDVCLVALKQRAKTTLGLFVAAAVILTAIAAIVAIYSRGDATAAAAATETHSGPPP